MATGRGPSEEAEFSPERTNIESAVPDARFCNWRASLGRTITHSKRSISCSYFHFFQQTGESASRSEPVIEASTSSINARFVHGTAHLLFVAASGNSERCWLCRSGQPGMTREDLMKVFRTEGGLCSHCAAAPKFPAPSTEIQIDILP